MMVAGKMISKTSSSSGSISKTSSIRSRFSGLSTSISIVLAITVVGSLNKIQLALSIMLSLEPSFMAILDNNRAVFESNCNLSAGVVPS